MAIKKSSKQKKRVRIDLELSDVFDKMLVLGSAFTYLAKDLGDEFIEALEKHDILVGEEGRKTAQDIRRSISKRKEKVKNTITKELRKAVKEIGIATKEDLKKIKR